jgi:hypothetical protein
MPSKKVHSHPAPTDLSPDCIDPEIYQIARPNDLNDCEKGHRCCDDCGNQEAVQDEVKVHENLALEN